MSISAVVMALNEERNLEYCLRSLRSWCDEIVVVDMRSEDRTVAIAQRYSDTILEHGRIEGFDIGREKGFAAASGDWHLSIDADEVVRPELAAWLTRFVESDPAFELALIPRVDVFLGRWIKTIPWWPGKPRFFRRGAVEVTAQLHRGLVPRAGVRVATLPRDPRLAMWHFTYPSIESLVRKTNRYTTIEARQALDAGGRDPRWYELIDGPLRALGWYVIKRGYRDGMAGLAYNVDRLYYRFLAVAKRWDESRTGGRQQRYDELRERILTGYPAAGRLTREEASSSATEP